MQIFDKLADVLLLPAIFGAGLFSIVYFFRATWSSSRVGRAMLLQSFAWLAVLLLAILTAWLGDEFHGREIYRVLAYGFAVWANWNMVFTFISIQRFHELTD